MDRRGTRRWAATTGAVAAALLLTGCATSAGRTGTGMMGGSGYHYAAGTCRAPGDLPGATVRVVLADRGMTRMMRGVAPSGAHMRLVASTGVAPAGEVSLVAANRGWRPHELVVLPLADGARAGDRVPGANGRVSEDGSLGEASASCAAGTGDGIGSGAVGWTTLRLSPGRYELLCNLRNHYTAGMYAELDVS